MESGPQNRNKAGLLGPNSIIVVYVDPLGNLSGLTSGILCPIRALGEGHAVDAINPALPSPVIRNIP